MPTARTIARLSQRIDGAENAIALAPAGDRSVHVLYTGLSGEGIVRVDADGGVQRIASSELEIWADVISLR